MNVHEVSQINFNQTAVDFLIFTFKKLQSKKEKITIALSGGSTPLPILKRLIKEDLDWKKFYFFMVDERCVPLKNPDSNYGTIKKLFFDHIDAHHYSMIYDGVPMEVSVENYRHYLSKIVSQGQDNFPVFDLILLGMGEDGHTASLFPCTEALKIEREVVVKNYVPQLNTSRITLTYPTIIKAAEIVVIIKGKSKKRIFDELYMDKKTDYPIQKIVDKRCDLNWIIERT